MGKRNVNIKRLVTLALSVCVAMLLSYVEMLIPAPVAVPGVKLGLANVATVFALYALGPREACAVSLVRVCLSSLLFGNAVGLIYSLSGAVLSLGLMILFSRLRIFSIVGVSVIGGVAHNVGQILSAMALMQTAAIASYLPVLAISGTLSGIVIGAVSGIAVRRISRIIK